MRINEIFYSLQGEGFYSGTAAVFLRLSGCNLNCSFCDTQHQHYNEMTDDEILSAISVFSARHIVITGGEPTLQLSHSFVEKLHKAGFYVQIETNGTNPVPDNVNWVTCSPKGKLPVCGRIDELKVVFESPAFNPNLYNNVSAKVKYLQPCDTKNPILNQKIISAVIGYIKKNPSWRLSLQTHKILDIQ